MPKRHLENHLTNGNNWSSLSNSIFPPPTMSSSYLTTKILSSPMYWMDTLQKISRYAFCWTFSFPYFNMDLVSTFLGREISSKIDKKKPSHDLFGGISPTTLRRLANGPDSLRHEIIYIHCIVCFGKRDVLNEKLQSIYSHSWLR